MRTDITPAMRNYVNPESPLGPVNAHVIEDVAVAAKLFDPHNKSFNALLRKEISVLIGRRGAGKTSLINSYRYIHYMDSPSSPIKVPAGVDVKKYEIIFEITAKAHFAPLLRLVAKEEKLIEEVREDWESHIHDFILGKLFDTAREDFNAYPELKIIASYLRQSQSEADEQARKDVWGQDLWHGLRIFFTSTIFGRSEEEHDGDYISQKRAMLAAQEYLGSVKKNVAVTFDSMDEYQVGDLAFDRTIGALIQFVSNFNARSDKIKIKLAVPSEIYLEIEKASANPLKDFTRYDQIQWTAIELAQIAAHRYRLFLQLYEPEFAEQFADSDFSIRREVTKFWNQFFPNKITNQYDANEDAYTYILRHTQLLPRQLFKILERTIVINEQRYGGYKQFGTDAVLDSVHEIEGLIAQEIFGAFRNVYSNAEVIGRTLFSEFPSVFSYKELESRWRRMMNHRPLHKDGELPEFVNLMDMLLRMGMVGTVVDETGDYIIAEFWYHLLKPPNRPAAESLCLHPIFSRAFNSKANSQGKAILPSTLSSRAGLSGFR